MDTKNVRPYLALLVGKEEDRFTEYLNQLLQDPHVLRAFVRDVCGLELPCAASRLSARTQITVPGGRPDLAITDSSTTYLLIEAKVGSWLHDDQLAPYALELSQWLEGHPAGVARLFLLCPDKGLRRSVQVGQEQLLAASAESVELVAVSWEQLAVFFRDISGATADARLVVYAADFADLIDWRLQDSPRAFTEDEASLLADPLAARTINSVRRVVRDVGAAIEGLIGDHGNLTASFGQGFDGYRLTLRGRRWWFGFWMDAWESTGSSPLFLQLLGWQGGPLFETPSDLPEPVKVSLFGQEKLIVPLLLHGGIDPSDVVTQLSGTIVDFCDRVPDSGEIA